MVEVMLILGFFSLEGNPKLYMRELYYDCVFYSERGDCERVKSKLQHICCRFYPFGLLDEIKERNGNFSMDVSQIG